MALLLNSVKYMAFMRKRCNTNPARGPFHLRSPSRIFWRTLRGMINYKIPKGTEALNRLKIFEGVPPKYQKVCFLSFLSVRV